MLFRILIVVALLCGHTAVSQPTYVRPGPAYFDRKLAEHYLDSLKHAGLRGPFITFITERHNKEITYLIWLTGQNMNAVQITDSTISRPLRNRRQHFKALLNPATLAIRQSENRLKFIPPINSRMTNTAFVESSTLAYIIQHGQNSQYILDKSKSRARAVFFQILAEDLNTLENGWQVAAPYNRFAD